MVNPTPPQAQKPAPNGRYIRQDPFPKVRRCSIRSAAALYREGADPALIHALNRSKDRSPRCCAQQWPNAKTISA